jgi:acyl-CoA reductase-like NAD-dependent aldehyde dehydrogenase
LHHAENLYPDVDGAMKAARRAFEQLGGLPLALRERMISHMRRAARENAQVLARLAWEETGMGRLEDKIEKNLLNANKVPGPEILAPTAWTGDDGMTLVEYAPYGVIGSITPSTNPTSSVICNAIGMVAAGNAVVFNGHPAAKACTNLTVQLLQQAIIEAGGPANLVCAVAEPTIESAQEIMRHPTVNLLTVTGGEGVVRAAMQSGKRAICAGPGNPPVVVDETADIDQAGRGIVRGASLWQQHRVHRRERDLCRGDRRRGAQALDARTRRLRDRCRPARAVDESHLHPGASPGEGRAAEQGIHRQERRRAAQGDWGYRR